MPKSRHRAKPRVQSVAATPAMATGSSTGKPWWVYLFVYGLIAFLIIGLLGYLLSSPVATPVV